MARAVSLVAALAVLLTGIVFFFSQEGDAWQAGLAKVEITPSESMWMSGYASRDRPSEGQLTPLWAKGLALEDPNGHKVLLITLDLIGIDRELSNRIRNAIGNQHGLERADILLNASHTHTGPVIGANLQPMYELSESEAAKVHAYTAFVEAAVIDLAARALAALRPSELAVAEGEATFGVNRRNNREDQVLQLRAERALKGPVDHAVPVLKVVRESKMAALVFGYACHATVLSSFAWSGDYPGFAQASVETRYPEVMALFWAGCGADINPLPRRSEDLARDYGEKLAQAVIEVVENDAMRQLGGPVETSYREIPLAFATVPTESELQSRVEEGNAYESRAAARLLERQDLMDYVEEGYPFPIQTWRFPDDGLTWLALGGEVVVDYALELRKIVQSGASGTENVWVAGYSNDVMAYIPSLRVLKEGGYEGAGAMVYYGLPGPWADDVEERIVAEVRHQVGVQ